jgi:endoglucanase
MQVTHHDCEWVRGAVIGSEKLPTWPLKDDKGNIICNRQKLPKDFHPWSGLSTQGAAIHFGEMGCYKHTPADLVLAWFNDTLDVLGELNSGWGLWNFRGPLECSIRNDQKPNSRIGKGIILIDPCSRSCRKK